MILNRIGLALRRQDWTTVVLELLILVIGILLALQVENWNSDRKEAAEARVWRAHIIEDLHKNRHDMFGRKNYYLSALKFGESALAGLESTAEVDAEQAWDIVLASFQAGQIWPYRLTGPSYREVQNAGKLALVADSVTLAALSYLYDVAAYDYELISGGLPRYRDMIRERLPWPVQQHIWNANCQATVYVEEYRDHYFELTDCDEPALDELLIAAVYELRSDQELIQALRGRLSQLMVTHAASNRQVERIEDVLDKLGYLLLLPAPPSTSGD